MKLNKTFKPTILEDWLCFAALAFLVIIPFFDLILTKFKLPIPDSRILMNHFFLVSCIFAAMITARSGQHISISAIQFIKNEKLKSKLVFAGILVAVFLLTVYAWNSICFITSSMVRYIGIVPLWIFQAAIPLGFVVIIGHLVSKLDTLGKRVSAVLAILLGCAAALPAIAKIFWGFEPPELFFLWVNSIYDAAEIIVVPVIVMLVIAAFAGMPIFAAIGGIALIMLLATGREPEEASRWVNSALTDTDIIAIPLFTLTGFFLSESKAGERLVRAFKILFGWMPGGIIIAAVIICTFFTSFTGASGVTILALGGILFTILHQNKYSEKFSTGLLTSVGGIGILFPPSLPIILVAATTINILHFLNIDIEHNIIDYFIGAIIPGIILMLTTFFAGLILSRKVKIEKEKFSSKEAGLSLKDSLFEILLPFVLILGYFSGTFTLVEASAVSVIYVIIVEVFIKKDIAVSNIPKVVSKAVPIIGGVIAILAMAKALSFAFIDSGVPDSFALWMQNTVQSKYVFLLLLNLGLLVLGCLMDIFSAILVFLPLVVPLGLAYGIDPVHLGIIFVINLEAGFLTPPVGMNLFLASYRFEKPYMQICANVAPFLIVRFLVILLVTYIPWFTTFLVNLFK